MRQPTGRRAHLAREGKAAGPASTIRHGVFIAVVGPSGAGKDTLISYAKARCGHDTDVLFVRRVITRPSHRSTEDHDSLTDEAFDRAEKAGAFALSWSAHGLKYGLPSSVDGAMASGRVLVANLSRGAVPSLRARYANVVTVHVTARPETLVERLAGRGRESAADIRERIARSKAAAPPAAGAVLLENDGPPEAAGERLVAVIHEAIGRLRRQIRGAGRIVPPK